MNNFPELEELVIDEKLEELIKGANRFSFPTVTLSTTVYFNIAADPFIPDYIKWSVTPNYVVITPAKKSDLNSYPTRKSRSGGAGKATTAPATLTKEKRVKDGTYRLYKYKNGLAFKRYESLEVENG